MSLSKNDVRETVRFLLVQRAEAVLQQRAGSRKGRKLVCHDVTCARPQLQLGFVATRYSMRLPDFAERYDAAVTARTPDAEAEYARQAAEYEETLRKEMASQLWAIRRGGLRMLAGLVGSWGLPKELRVWGRRQLERAQDSGKRSSWSLAYVLLILQDAVEWESCLAPEYVSSDPLDVAQSDWVAKHQDDRGRSVVFYDAEGNRNEVERVTDSPSSRSVDAAGWDRATSKGRSTKAAKPKPRKKNEAPRRFRIDFVDIGNGRTFELTDTGWYYGGCRVATSVAQRLDERKASGRLVKV